jgi:hypothetical protein
MSHSGTPRLTLQWQEACCGLPTNKKAVALVVFQPDLTPDLIEAKTIGSGKK